ncbi:MAG: MATE family efflux transporter [Collinsella sp.]
MSVNSFGADVTTAWGLSGRLDGIIWMVTEALGVSITTFSAQNFGARNYERMRKGYHTSLVLSFMLIGGLSAVLLGFSARCRVCLSTMLRFRRTPRLSSISLRRSMRSSRLSKTRRVPFAVPA